MSVFAQAERLKIVPSGPAVVQDLVFWHAAYAELWVAFYKRDELTPLSGAAFAEIASVHLEVYEKNAVGASLLFDAVVDSGDIDTELTDEEWIEGDGQHVLFALEEANMDLTFFGKTGKFHYVVYVVTSDGKKVVSSGDFILRRNLAATDTVEPETGTPIVDADGNPIVDADGNPILSVP
jgi:hypothetical protein